MQNDILRQLPRVDELVNLIIQGDSRLPYDIVLSHSRQAIDDIRAKALSGQISAIPELNTLADSVILSIAKARTPSLRPVINASGVVIHTNLGRARLADEAANSVYQAAKNYTNLEYDIEKGERGSRHSHVEQLICQLTGCEAAFAVNNNAAAVMLTLMGMCSGGEVIVSRGELVEIGGAFRVPDIMSLSGAILKEVGTTNRTHLFDYQNAICEQTKALLKVHSSNFLQVGFTKEVELFELYDLAKSHDLPLIYDLGSGLIAPIEGAGDMTVSAAVKHCDVVCFSGDKLFGAGQAGIIVGKKSYIDRLKKHQLARAMRLDKLNLAALESTLRLYLEGRESEIPVISCITQSLDTLKLRANKLKKLLDKHGVRSLVTLCDAVVGGGSCPGESLKTYAVRLISERSETQIERELRLGATAIISRINKGGVLLDLRTIADEEFTSIAAFSAKAVLGERHE